MAIALKIDEMSLADKLEAMETLWDDLCHHVQDIAVPEWHTDELAAREAGLQEGKERFTDWESAKNAIRKAVK